MKGIELPVNVIVVLALGIVVLFGILFLFLGVWSPLPGAITPEAALNTACLRLITMGCDTDLNEIIIPNFDADKDGKAAGAKGDNLLNLCKYHFNKDDSNCRIACGC